MTERITYRAQQTPNPDGTEIVVAVVLDYGAESPCVCRLHTEGTRGEWLERLRLFSCSLSDGDEGDEARAFGPALWKAIDAADQLVAKR